MWLKDFLPEDVKNVRIMTYGYDSSLVRGTPSDLKLFDYVTNFIQQLENSRSTVEVRKCLFVATADTDYILRIRVDPSFSWGTVSVEF